MAKKTKETQPFGSCPSCWQHHKDEDLVLPLITENPNLIVIKDWAFTNTAQADRFLMNRCQTWGVRPIVLSARQCKIHSPITLNEIKRNRESFLVSVTSEYPLLPIVAIGGLAASLVAGGKCTETSMVNKVFNLCDRVCAFTYSFEYYFREGRKDDVLRHIETTFTAALIPNSPAVYNQGLPSGNDLENVIIDVETTDAKYPFVGNSICNLIGVMPVGKSPYLINPASVTASQKAEMADKVRLVIGHNVMFDLIHLAHCGIAFPKARVHDTLIYHKNTFPEEPFNGLKALAKKYCKFPHWDAWFASNHGKVDISNNLDWMNLCNYNAIDLYATEALYNKQRKTYHPFLLEMDYLKYILKMIMNGFYVDKSKLEVMLDGTSKALADVETDVRSEFSLGADFNFNSPLQVLNFLQKQIPTVTGTGAEVLLEYKDDHPFVGRLLEIRDLSKLKGTGLEGLKEHLDANNLVHSSYAVHGAETGRSSSSAPNLQNTDPRVRSLFVSRFLGGKLIHTDLAGIEYRLIGHASQDNVLLNVFNSGKDIHDEMYLALFGVMPPNKTERKKAKTGNFCGVYGGGYNKFIQAVELPNNPASRKLYKVVSERYKGVQTWKEAVIKDLWKTKKVKSIFGRSRQFSVVDMDAEREAVNWVIQSSGHDILDIYLMELCDLLEEKRLLGSLLVSEVHDSVTFDCPADEYERVYEVVKGLAANLNPLILEMFGVKMRVPIVADVEIMEKWS